jgi:hypothetical protein
VRLVEHEQIRARRAGGVAGRRPFCGSIDDVNREVGERSGAGVRDLVFDEDELRTTLGRQPFDRQIGVAAVIDGDDPCARKRLVADEEFTRAILAGSRLSGHDRDAVAVSKQAAQREEQRRLSAVGGAADADGVPAHLVVAHGNTSIGHSSPFPGRAAARFVESSVRSSLGAARSRSQSVRRATGD